MLCVKFQRFNALDSIVPGMIKVRHSIDWIVHSSEHIIPLLCHKVNQKDCQMRHPHTNNRVDKSKPSHRLHHERYLLFHPWTFS
jgi:hypothetical protein